MQQGRVNRLWVNLVSIHNACVVENCTNSWNAD